MQRTKDGIKTNSRVRTPEAIINFITEGQTPDRHRANLSAMLIAWLKDESNFTKVDELKEEVYNTYHVLTQVLEGVHQLGLVNLVTQDVPILVQQVKKKKSRRSVKPIGIIDDLGCSNYSPNKALFTISDICKPYGISAAAMNNMLQRMGIIHKKGGNYFLAEKYKCMGIAKRGTVPFIVEGTTYFSSVRLSWTEKGVSFVKALILKERMCA